MASGYHGIIPGEKPTAATVNDYWSKQVVMVFPDTATRDAALSGIVREGMRCCITATDREYQYDGTNWIVMSEPTQSLSTTVTSTGGTLTSVSGGGSYHRADGYIDWTVTITVTNNGTGSGAISFTVPIAPSAAAQDVVGFGREAGVSGKLLQVYYSAGSTFLCTNYDNTYPAAAGAILHLSGRYRMTTRYS